MRQKKPQSITVIGKRWFNRGPGNTYHSTQILIDGAEVHFIPFEYGYDDGYIQSAQEWLLANGYLPRAKKYPNTGGHESLWQYCRRMKIAFAYSVADVSRRKDL